MESVHYLLIESFPNKAWLSLKSYLYHYFKYFIPPQEIKNSLVLRIKLTKNLIQIVIMHEGFFSSTFCFDGFTRNENNKIRKTIYSEC